MQCTTKCQPLRQSLNREREGLDPVCNLITENRTTGYLDSVSSPVAIQYTYDEVPVPVPACFSKAVGAVALQKRQRYLPHVGSSCSTRLSCSFCLFHGSVPVVLLALITSAKNYVMISIIITLTRFHIYLGQCCLPIHCLFPSDCLNPLQ